MTHKITIKNWREVVLLYDTADDEFRSASEDVVQAIKDGFDPFDGTFPFTVDQTLVNDWADGDSWIQAAQIGTNATDTASLVSLTAAQVAAVISSKGDNS